jgi:hypothetical protein
MEQEQKTRPGIYAVLLEFFSGSGATSSEQQKICTARTQYRKFETNIPRKGIFLSLFTAKRPSTILFSLH